MFKLSIVLLTIALSSCATKPSYTTRIQSWVGSSSDELVRKYGPPQRTFQLNNGDTVFEYMNVGGHAYTFVNNSYGVTSFGGQGWCKTTFYVNDRGYVSGGRWDGNDCE